MHALLAGLAALWLIWSFVSYPLLNDSSSAAGTMRRAREVAGAQTEIGLVALEGTESADAARARAGLRIRARLESRSIRKPCSGSAENPAQRRVFILDEAMGDCVDQSKADARRRGESARVVAVRRGGGRCRAACRKRARTRKR